MGLAPFLGVTGWNDPEFFVYIDDAWWDVWVPDAGEWDGNSTVGVGYRVFTAETF